MIRPIRKLSRLSVIALSLSACAPSVPDLPVPGRSVWLDQNWSSEQREWFHHASQGTATLPIPVEWFVAIEQPELRLFGTPGLFSDPAFLRRFGFIGDTAGPRNDEGLPIGFAVDRDFKDPISGRAFHALGYTCAACHTGHLTFRGTEIRIDGGPATTDVTRLAVSLGYAMAYTKYVPGRFQRFAGRILGPEHSPSQATELREAFDAVWTEFQRIAALEKSVKDDSTEEGFTRLDALNRIGNQVFGTRFLAANYRPTSAPVNYPHIWSTPWFLWVQYDGSIMQPMVRNAGEALGVAAGVDLTGSAEARFASTVKVDTLHELEGLLAGTAPTVGRRFNGLAAPKWPEAILGAIDRSKADRGAALYSRHCEGCHLAPPDSAAFWADKRWVSVDHSERRYLNLTDIPIDEIGTDPMQAKALAERSIDTRGLGLNTTILLQSPGGRCEPQAVTDGEHTPYGAALGAVVQQVTGYWYQRHQVSAADQERLNGYRPNCLIAAMQYTARPLSGIWATPPFLHNGSVPTLFALLSPAAERPTTFYLGNPEFDPVRVGYVTDAFDGGSLLDTGKTGNSNRGHEFDDRPKGNGIIGPRLTEEQRWDLIEYLKTL
ncbi:MAG: di-heme-cytochrome C peroxidase [Methylotetracoccus sp.]